MALNFSHRPMFRSCLPEDTLVSHMKRVSNGYHVDEKADGCFDYLMDGSDGSGLRGSQESSVHKDILDLLPSDPFGMDISNTFTMITGWLEDLEVDYARYGSGHQTDGVEANRQFLSGFDFIWNNVMSFQAFPGDLGFDPKSKVVGGFNSWCCQQEAGLFPGIRADELAYNDANVSIMEDKMMNDSDANPVDARCQELLESDNLALNEKMEAPHEALTFSLCHLGVRDLLMVELVCKSLHFTVQNDPLLWRSIHIDQPLNEKITDDVLIKLANRAQGNLQCLSLVECPRITDEGLKHIVENNLLLTKVSVPGCTRLSIDGILASLRALKSGGAGARGVKHLRIGGLYGVTLDHFEELRILLGAEDRIPGNDHKPHYYNRGNFYVSCEDDRAIDIEVCPRCQNLRLVYDCPLDGCEGKAHPTKVCRACTLCIARCIQCGECIYDGEYEETFCLELLCSECWKLLPQCPGQERNHGSAESLEESSFISNL